MEIKVCPKCGTQNPSSAMECMSCGKYLSIETLKDIDSGQSLSDKDFVTTIGIGLLVGFIGTAFLVNLMTWGNGIMFYLVNSAIGGIFGIIGSVIGYRTTKSIRGVWIGAILGTIIIPSCWFIAFLTGAG